MNKPYIQEFRKKFLNPNTLSSSELFKPEVRGKIVPLFEAFIEDILDRNSKETREQVMNDLDAFLDVTWVQEEGEWFGKFRHDEFMALMRKPKKAMDELSQNKESK